MNIYYDTKTGKYIDLFDYKNANQVLVAQSDTKEEARAYIYMMNKASEFDNA